MSFIFIIVSLPAESAKKRRKISRRALSISFVSAYTFYALPDLKPDQFGSQGFVDKKPIFGDSQMESVFSALEVSRNFGNYEVGARIQNTFSSFVSPFFKFNFVKNYSNANFVPSFTVGVSPSSLLIGAWIRLGAAFSLNRYLSLEPFAGTYAYYKIEDMKLPYEKSKIYFHAGLRFNLYF